MKKKIQEQLDKWDNINASIRKIIENEYSALDEAFLSGVISKQQYDEKLKKLMSNMWSLEKEYEKIRKQILKH